MNSSRNIRLNTRKNSYDPAKYESLGTVNLSMSVNVSFEAPAPKPSGFFGSAPKPVPVNKQQKLTETQNSMIASLKRELVNHAPPGTEMLIDLKIGHIKNIGHSPEYILSMNASATAVRKVSEVPAIQALVDVISPVQSGEQPAPVQSAPVQSAPVQPAPQAQMGGKKKRKNKTNKASKTRKHRR